jgi:hypothetical protein
VRPEVSDSFALSCKIDSGTELSLFSFAADDAASQNYILADGSTETRNDPLTVVGTGDVLSNGLQTLSAALYGTGSVLNLTCTAQALADRKPLPSRTLWFRPPAVAPWRRRPMQSQPSAAMCWRATPA